MFGVTGIEKLKRVLEKYWKIVGVVDRWADCPSSSRALLVGDHNPKQEPLGNRSFSQEWPSAQTHRVQLCNLL